MKLLKGFTLAEVLISLLVVGVLAAILSPILRGVTPNQNRVFFKKAYSVIVTGISDLINDEQSYPSNILGNAINPPTNNVSVGFNNISTAGTLVPLVTFGTAPNTYQYTPNKFCYLFSQEINTVGAENCPTLYGNGTFQTRNGMSWTIVNPPVPRQFPLDNQIYSTRLVVDVNGTMANSNDKAHGPDCSYLPVGGAMYNNVTWNQCDVTKVWPSNPNTGVANPNGIVPDIYDIGVRYDGSVTLYKMNAAGTALDTTTVDNAANEILTNPSKSNK